MIPIPGIIFTRICPGIPEPKINNGIEKLQGYT